MNRMLLYAGGIFLLGLIACDNTGGNGELSESEKSTDTTAVTSTQADTMSTDPSEEEVELSPLESRKWTMLDYTYDGEEHQPTGDVDAFARFDAGRMTGTTGCNDFNGGYELSGETGISIGNIATTKKMCPSLMVQERRLLELLRGASEYQMLSRKVVEFRSAKGKITFQTDQAVEGNYE